MKVKPIVFLMDVLRRNVSLPGCVSVLTGTSTASLASASEYMNSPLPITVAATAGASAGYGVCAAAAHPSPFIVYSMGAMIFGAGVKVHKSMSAKYSLKPNRNASGS